MHVHALLHKETDKETLTHANMQSKSTVMEQVGGTMDRHSSYARTQASCSRIVTRASANAYGMAINDVKCCVQTICVTGRDGMSNCRR